MMTKRCWTFMVYMAEYNGKVFNSGTLMALMEDAGYEDIVEMEAVGSTKDVALLIWSTIFEQKGARSYEPTLERGQDHRIDYPRGRAYNPI